MYISTGVYNVITKYICLSCPLMMNLDKMGTIISSKKDGDDVIVEVLTAYNEFLQLKGHLNDVYLITKNVAEVQTNISQRGKNEATKYFLIPRQFRKGFKFNNTTSCQRLDFKDKVMFVYIIDKLKINASRKEITLEKLRAKNKLKESFK